MTGVIAVVALAIRREDRRYTLVREAPDRISRSARRLTGVGRRGLDAEFFPIARELVRNRADQHFSGIARRLPADGS